VAAYAALAGDRFGQVVVGLGVAGTAVLALGLLIRQPLLLPWGIAGVGAGYAVFLSLRADTVDSRAPLVAAALFVAAELAFWSVELGVGRRERAVVLRRVSLLAAEAFATALLAALLLVVAGGARAGLGFEALGVLAAVSSVAIVAVLTARAKS
jgi:hypothetical protein